MNATVHAIKAQIIGTLRHDAPPATDRVTALEAENVRLRARITDLELLHVSSVGVMLSAEPVPELVRLHVEDVRKALSTRNEAPR